MSGMVIIGAGHAAGQAAASLRQEKYEGPITIIGDEPHIPYQRPPCPSSTCPETRAWSGSTCDPKNFMRKKTLI